MDQIVLLVPVPPDASIVAVPRPLLQRGLSDEMVVVNAEAGCVIVTVFVDVQLEASETVTVLTPAFKPVITDVVAPDDHK